MDPAVVRRFCTELEEPFTELWDPGPRLEEAGAELPRPGHRHPVEVTGQGSLPSVFAVTALATAAMGVAARAAGRLVSQLGGPGGVVTVDQRLASLWFGATIVPDGWTLSPAWDAIAGDYETSDGWIKLHTNAPHHKRAALAVLGCRAEREVVGAAVRRWTGDDLEAEIVTAGGCAARLRTEDDWAAHPQGRAVAGEPTVHLQPGRRGPERMPAAEASRPLSGVRVLDLTRVLAGPVATRFLAGLGADVLRIDPPTWDEPGVVPEVVRGKRCGRLDLGTVEGRAELRLLLERADILMHGYRPGALDGLGLSAEERQTVAPGLVDVSLDAYGWTGPLAARRGFDSLVQMSTGIAATGMERTTADRPRPLPVQALDHTTGYLMAATALHAWADRLATGRGWVGRASLARTARILTSGPRTDPDTAIEGPGPADHEPEVEMTSWGPARRLTGPVTIPGTRLVWDRPATDLGSEPPPLGWLS
jgi:crotonobetainyl-CoA:carnitine CoA-transferase CaiB-like acyl-CoA transferase